MYLQDKKISDPCDVTLWQRVEISLATLGIGSMNYELACRKVGDDLNYNIGFPCATWIYSSTIDPDTFYNRGCYKIGEIKCIINAYIDMVEEGKIPEYKRDKNTLETIRTTLSKITGKNEGRIGAILDAFHFATVDGRVNNNFYIAPLTFRKNYKYQQTPVSVEQVSNSFSIGDFFKYTAYTIIGGVALAVAYEIYDKTSE